MTELSVRQRIERGKRAAIMLADPLLIEAIENANAEVVSDWLGSDSFDESRARDVWATHQAMSRLRVQLRRYEDDGEFAQTEDLLD